METSVFGGQKRRLRVETVAVFGNIRIRVNGAECRVRSKMKIRENCHRETKLGFISLNCRGKQND